MVYAQDLKSCDRQLDHESSTLSRGTENIAEICIDFKYFTS